MGPGTTWQESAHGFKLIKRAAPMPPTPIPLRGDALFTRAKSGKHNFGPIFPYLAIGKLIHPGTNLFFQFSMKLVESPESQPKRLSETHFPKIPPALPFLYPSNTYIYIYIYIGKPAGNLPNDFARIFWDPSRVVASALLCRHSSLACLVNC